MNNFCARCGRANDLFDYEYCTACCTELIELDKAPRLPGRLANTKLFFLQKMGIGRVPALTVIGMETLFAVGLHQPIILPTPMGHDIIMQHEDKIERIAMKVKDSRITGYAVKGTKFLFSRCKEEVKERICLC